MDNLLKKANNSRNFLFPSLQGGHKVIPCEAIDKNENTGMPPPSPESLLSSEELENCSTRLSFDTLKKYFIDLVVLIASLITAT